MGVYKRIKLIMWNFCFASEIKIEDVRLLGKVQTRERFYIQNYNSFHRIDFLIITSWKTKATLNNQWTYGTAIGIFLGWMPIHPVGVVCSTQGIRLKVLVIIWVYTLRTLWVCEMYSMGASCRLHLLIVL